jgi:hypothetical protein
MLGAVAGVLAACVAMPALADDAPCAADVARHCRDVAAGGGRIVRCLDAHRAVLAPACRSVIAQRATTFARLHPCAADRERFCGDVQPGPGAVGNCLRSHAAELSATCRRALGARAGQPVR